MDDESCYYPGRPFMLFIFRGQTTYPLVNMTCLNKINAQRSERESRAQLTLSSYTTNQARSLRRAAAAFNLATDVAYVLHSEVVRQIGVVTTVPVSRPACMLSLSCPISSGEPSGVSSSRSSCLAIAHENRHTMPGTLHMLLHRFYSDGHESREGRRNTSTARFLLRVLPHGESRLNHTLFGGTSNRSPARKRSFQPSGDEL